MRSSVLDARPPAPPPLTTCRDEQRKHVAHRPRAGRPPVEARARPRSSPNANSRTLIISMLLVLLARAAAEDPVAIAAASASSGTGWQEWLESMIPASANLAAARGRGRQKPHCRKSFKQARRTWPLRGRQKPQCRRSFKQARRTWPLRGRQKTQCRRSFKRPETRRQRLQKLLQLKAPAGSSGLGQ